MSYDKIKAFVYYIRGMQEAELDSLCIISSPKGFGKSTGAIQISRTYIKEFGLTCNSCEEEWVYTGNIVNCINYTENQKSKDFSEPCPYCNSKDVKRTKELNFTKYLAYDNEDVYNLIHEIKPFSPIIPDEGVRFMMSEDWNVKENKQMKKLFAQMRTKRLLVFANIPKFEWVDKKYRNDMATFWIRILKRGFALLLQPDLGEKDDPWDIKLFKETLGSYFYFTDSKVIEHRAERLKGKHPCVFDYFYIPPLPKDIYAEYQKVRDQKVFEKQKQEETFTDKELSKLVLYNLANNPEALLDLIRNSSKKGISLEKIRLAFFIHPVTKKPLISNSAFAIHHKEVKELVAKKQIEFQDLSVRDQRKKRKSELELYKSTDEEPSENTDSFIKIIEPEE